MSGNPSFPLSYLLLAQPRAEGGDSSVANLEGGKINRIRVKAELSTMSLLKLCFDYADPASLLRTVPISCVLSKKLCLLFLGEYHSCYVCDEFSK